MIQELYQFFFQGIPNQTNQNFQFDLSLDYEPLNFVSIQQIIFPKTIYQINQAFQITIDATIINFQIGNLSFQQLKTYLQNQLGSTNYTVIEQGQPYFQTGKLQISRTSGIIPINFICQPQNASFFGNLVWDYTNNYLVSQQICELNTQQQIILKSQVCSNSYQQYGSANILYQFQLDNTANYNFYQQDVDIVQNKQKFSGSKFFQFQFLDISGNLLQFQGNQQFYVKLVIFHYRTQFIDIVENHLDNLLQLYFYKNFKKTFDNEQDEQEFDKRKIDIKNEIPDNIDQKKQN